MIADILGMTWWTLLIISVSFCFGVFCSGAIKNYLQK